MNDDEIFDFIDTLEIDDTQAVESDFDGDSDAEDSQLNKSKAVEDSKSYDKPGTSTATIPETCSAPQILDFDSDDSLQDPTFIPDDTPKKRGAIFDFSSSDENEDEEVSNLDRVGRKMPKHKKKLVEKVKRSVQFDDNEESVRSRKELDSYQWTSPSSCNASSFDNFHFVQNIGPNIQVNFNSPVEIFNSFFDDFLKQLIVNESNKYAQQRGDNLDLTVREFEAFIGVLIIMGFHKLPSLRMYWSSDSNLQVGRVAEIMSLKRFLKILRFLHLNDNETMPKRNEDNFDKLYKVRPLLIQLNKKFLSNFNPGRQMSVDESMIAFKGRSSLKQYLPLKPIKRGFKVWALACSTSGYLVQFSIYEGKSQGEETGTLGERTVINLSKPFVKKGYCLFFDNFFSTVPLMDTLLKDQFFACGTFRSNRRHCPKDIFENSKKMKLGESRTASCGEISISVWKDRGTKPVCIISNMHDPRKETVIRRTNIQGEKEEIKCPLPVSDYNSYMGGVDHFDQLLECYSIAHKSRRWWMKIFYYLVDATIVNSYIIYNMMKRKTTRKDTPQIEFRSMLANQLIGDFCTRNKRGRSSTDLVRSNKMKKMSGREITVQNSFVMSSVGDHIPGEGTRRRCGYCSTRAKPRRTTTICRKCNVALHPRCFAAFHNK